MNRERKLPVNLIIFFYLFKGLSLINKKKVRTLLYIFYYMIVLKIFIK